MPTTIALIAHESQRDALFGLVQRHAPVFARYRLIAPSDIAQMLQRDPTLQVESLLSTAMGGIAQVASRVAEGGILAVISLYDPLVTFEQPDIQTLIRLCTWHNVLLTTNLATAEAIIAKLAKTLIAHLIFNPVAGQRNADQDLSIIRSLLEPHLQLEIHYTTPEVNPAELAKAAIAANADLILASGGDGTVSMVAGALIGSGVPLGIIPRGTANAFAASLGLPRLFTIQAACNTILAGKTRTVDAARCNDMPMILLAGIGYEAETVELASRELKTQWGAMAYLMAGWQQLSVQTQFEATFELEDRVFQAQASAITIANAAPPTSVMAQGAGAVIFDDGLLDVTIATAENRLQAVSTMLQMFGAALAKSDPDHPNVIHIYVNKLRVTTNPAQKVVVDGELIGTTPIEVECIPAGLTVLAPMGEK